MKRVEQLLGIGAGLSLFCMMALTFFDVVGRKFLGDSITGSVELTELFMIGTIFFALPIVSLRGEHVLFDLLDAITPHWALGLQKVLSHLLCAGLMLGGSWLVWRRAVRIFEDGDTTAQLIIPKGPFVVAIAALLAATGLMHLYLATRPRESEHTGGRDAAGA